MHWPARRLAPRLIAWAALLAGAASYVAAVPKGAIESFDAAVRDNEAAGRRVIALLQSFDSAEAELARQSAEAQSRRARRDRMALLSDLANHPRRAAALREMVLVGAYYLAPADEQALLRDNADYTSLVQEIDHPSWRAGQAGSVVNHGGGEPGWHRYQRYRLMSVVAADGTLRRRFRRLQARLFWWGWN